MSKQRSILLIDDYDYIIEGTAALLRFEGFTFLAASNGRDGIRLAREHHPDLVICDIFMLEMDGYTGFDTCVRIQRPHQYGSCS